MREQWQRSSTGHNNRNVTTDEHHNAFSSDDIDTD